MKKKILCIVLLMLSLTLAMLAAYKNNGYVTEAITFMCGFIGGMSIVLIRLNSKNLTLNSYKRELEKESISSNESAARVKVLESKIEVLEKALDNALKK